MNTVHTYHNYNPYFISNVHRPLLALRIKVQAMNCKPFPLNQVSVSDTNVRHTTPHQGLI